MKKITRDDKDLDIQIHINEEDIPVRGNFATDEPELDRKLEDEIIERLNRGDLWAWCHVTVFATYRGTLTASESLGGCSYADEADFRRGGYFDDMLDACIDRLNEMLAKIIAD